MYKIEGVLLAQVTASLLWYAMCVVWRALLGLSGDACTATTTTYAPSATMPVSTA